MEKHHSEVGIFIFHRVVKNIFKCYLNLSVGYNPQDELVTTCFRLIAFFRENFHIVRVDSQSKCVNFHYSDLIPSLSDGLFCRLLEEIPESLFSILGVAACEVYYEKQPIGTAVIKLAVRLYDFTPIQPFRELKAFQIDKFIAVQGNVVRTSMVRPFLVKAAFKCAKCMQLIILSLKDGIYRTPTKCTTTHCNSKAFFMERNCPETICLNWQKIKLQEVTDSNDFNDEGRIPRILEAELTNDLVDSVVPGELVTLCGILKTLDCSEKVGQPSNSTTSAVYLDVISVQKMKNLDATLGKVANSTSLLLQVPPNRLQEILSLPQDKFILQTLVRSFCPHIYGNELVKMGLLLGLFGGSRRVPQPGIGSLVIRSDPHILIVGDPGLGKSQLLNFAAMVAPRAVYVCANTSTAVGLTATVQDGALEAGALVLADQGCCCIDEFDKIVGDSWRSLLDVMEQQTVNVAKAGVVCALPARASIFAAANPTGGHYNKGKSVVENLKMDSALLSRFDLIFVLLDRPNADMDRVLSEHVLGNINSGGEKMMSVPPIPSSSFSTQLSNTNDSLRQRLDPKKPGQIISDSLLRQYIAYARQKVTPRMTEEAAIVLREFYLTMRRDKRGEEAIPVTTRLLESMIRLSEARAKMELRTFVTIQDASDVVELVGSCTLDLSQAGSGSGNRNDISSNLTKSRKGSKGSALKRYVTELIKISSRTGDTDFSNVQLQSLYDTLGIPEVPFRELIDSLNEHGYLLKKSNCFRLLVT